jgi:hypothetical protein
MVGRYSQNVAPTQTNTDSSMATHGTFVQKQGGALSSVHSGQNPVAPPLPSPDFRRPLQDSETSTAKIQPPVFEDTKAAWRPMAWLPRLRIFHSPLEDWTFSAKQRGTLIHHCLEYLHITGHGAESATKDALRATVRGINTFPLLIPDRENVLRDIAHCISWYASLPETAHWLAFGNPEHILMDGQGKSHRVDLLVDDGRERIAVEYKTGTPGELPAPEHTMQLLHYLKLLEQTSSSPVRGSWYILTASNSFL